MKFFNGDLCAPSQETDSAMVAPLARRGVQAYVAHRDHCACDTAWLRRLGRFYALPTGAPFHATGRSKLALGPDWTLWRMIASVKFLHVREHVMPNAMPRFLGHYAGWLMVLRNDASVF
ncbi:hypothetical protein [Mesorhizobium sp. CO1-1-9]|uniref:hypothetical protein n=1 Tax=Mesorhizobium sp. CO1-1-9 TaxID=2876630 RepID=UPI001CD01703|nr:hypothetical protein [Mesorhizobium sp. CO1-1-9]MBZ9698815.1 hypothetical protein [Mesorhizobium sp. CO1-1-9]